MAKLRTCPDKGGGTQNLDFLMEIISPMIWTGDTQKCQNSSNLHFYFGGPIVKEGVSRNLDFFCRPPLYVGNSVFGG